LFEFWFSKNQRQFLAILICAKCHKNAMIITNKNLIQILKELFPAISKDIKCAYNHYDAMGIVALYLRNGLKKTIDKASRNNAINLINSLAAHDNADMQNLLVAGLLEVLYDYDSLIYDFKKELSPKAISLYSEYFNKQNDPWSHWPNGIQN
jgi:hypothetical protein